MAADPARTERIDGMYLQCWCVCFRTERKTKWGIYHDDAGGPLRPLIFASKRQASERARELSRSEEHKYRHWLFRAGKFFYSGEVSL